MNPILLKLLYASTVVIWTLAAAILTLGSLATGDTARSIYALAIFIATIGSVCSMWLIFEAIARRTAEHLRIELADAVALALRDHLKDAEPRRIHAVRH